MDNEIEKSEPSPDDVLTSIQSFNDPSIIINIFKELGWSYSLEIKETLMLAKQNANLSIKFKAVKHLRELLREAAETAGYVANVSTTAPNAHGGHTTFSAKRISGILNPTKQIDSTIKESENDRKEEIKTQCNRGSNREQSQDKGRPQGDGENAGNRPAETDTDTGRANSERAVDSGGTKPPDGGEASGICGEVFNSRGETTSDSSNPCIKTRPPTCDQELFPGVSSAGDS